MLKYLIEKEFKQIRRNPFLPRLVVMFPLVVMILIPMVASYEVKNINLAVIDNDRSTLSVRLIHKITSSGYFILADFSDSYEDSLLSLEQDRSDIILEIPPDFELNLSREKTGDLSVSANAVNAVKGGLGSAYLAAIIQDFFADLNPQSSGNRPGSVEIIPQYRYNPYLRYPVFIVPALMVMLLIMICGFLPALNIVGEREKGTLEQINVTPVKRFDLILSKLIPYWIIGFIVLTIGFIVARLVYSLVPEGSLFTIYLFAFVFILGISGFGLIISNYGKTLQQAMFMMFFFIITFIFLSGLYTPVSSMASWARFMSHFVPLRYLMEVFRQVYLKGSRFQDLYPQLAALAGFAVFFNSWAVLSYRKTS